MINSRNINDLHPRVKAMCELFIQHCKAEGISVTITSTFRDNESQDALYAQGRTAPGKVVTKAKSGESFHNYKLAFDCVPVVNGVAQWNDNSLWSRIGQYGKECGLEWGGDFKSFKDKPHFEKNFGFDWKTLKSRFDKGIIINDNGITYPKI